MKFILDQAAYEALPDALKTHYAKRDSDGKYVLQIEGAVPSEKLVEFRDNNIRLQHEVDAWKAVGLSIDDIKLLKQKREDIENGRRSDGKTVAELVEERTAAHKKAADDALAAANAKLEKTTGELGRLKISDSALKKATELGLRPSAADDLAARVTGVFKLDADGKVIAQNQDGTPRYGKNAEPLAIDEYVQGLVEAAPHLFEASNGTGSRDGGKGNGNKGPVVNPWKKETQNVTRQGEVYKQNPDLARRMAAEAGVKLP